MAEKEKDSADWMDGAVAFIEHMNQRDDLFDAIAALNKKQFDALVRTGFREDQAIRIVALLSQCRDQAPTHPKPTPCRKYFKLEIFMFAL